MNVEVYDLTEKQVQAAIDNYIYRRDYMKQRNQRDDVKEKRREYNKKRYAEMKEAMKQYRSNK